MRPESAHCTNTNAIQESNQLNSNSQDQPSSQTQLVPSFQKTQ